MKDTKNRLSRITIALHWLAGLTFITLTAMGIYMVPNEVWGLYPIHESVGLLLFIVVLLRVVWRAWNGWPLPIRDYRPYELMLSKVIRWVLLLATLLMPLTAIVGNLAGGFDQKVFGVEIWAKNVYPQSPDEVLPFVPWLSEASWQLHVLLGYFMVAVISLHVLAALKHHLIDKDNTLRRMFGKDLGHR